MITASQLKSIKKARLPTWVNMRPRQSIRRWSAPPHKPDICALVTQVSNGPTLLQKSFWGGERKFLEPLMHFTSGDVRDHIVSSKIDHGPS
jgi:hypothetical protein